MPQSPDRKLRVTFLTPTQWEKDDARVGCAGCKRLFSLFFRKHHCRLCGQIFCHACSLRRVYTKRVCTDCYVTTTQMMKVKRQRAKEKWLQRQAGKTSMEGKHMPKSSSTDSIKAVSSPESESRSHSRTATSTNSLAHTDSWYSVFRLCCRADDVHVPSPIHITTPSSSPPQHHPVVSPTAPVPPSRPFVPSDLPGFGLTKRVASVPKNMSCTSLASICECSSEEDEDEEDEEDEEEEDEDDSEDEHDVKAAALDEDEEDEEPEDDEPPDVQHNTDLTRQQCRPQTEHGPSVQDWVV